MSFLRSFPPLCVLKIDLRTSSMLGNTTTDLYTQPPAEILKGNLIILNYY
jgi:hypothetical protein